MRRVVSTGRRSRALSETGGARLGRRVEGGNERRRSDRKDLRRMRRAALVEHDRQGDAGEAASWAILWQRGRQGRAGGVMARAGRTSSGHRSHAIGPAQSMGRRGRTLEGGRAGESAGRNTWTLCPGRGKDAAIGRALAIGGNRASTSREPITPRNPRHRAGIPPQSPQAHGLSRRLARSAAPASIAPARRGARPRAPPARARRRAGTRSRSGAGRQQQVDAEHPAIGRAGLRAGA